MKKSQVFVALSGGVDSSVAVLLLLKRGYRVIGCYIKGYNVDGCGEQEVESARCVAAQLGIPFYVFDLEKEYKAKVINYMVSGYRRGLTPNPDVMCNKEIKFGLFLEKALALGADYVATGHYAKKKLNNGLYQLFQARDKNKDQTYFLWTLTQNRLRHCLFPLGNYTKKQVRALARRFSLITAAKKDSQGICFLGKVALVDFLKRYLPEKRGDVLDTAGKKIGEHRGAHFYTIGQRHGFEICHSCVASSSRHLEVLADDDRRRRWGRNLAPLYVVDKSIKQNTITIAKKDNSTLFKSEIGLTGVNFVSPVILSENHRSRPKKLKNSIGVDKIFSLTALGRTNKKMVFSVLVRIRHRQPLQKAKLIIFWSPQIQKIKISFEKPQKSIAPGQSAVFYNKNGSLLGGGIITVC